ncbi:MAG: molecular chaperone DnaK [Desulfuromonas sp.]|nr:MAG: molecular chaperone DnaK [Desulfuromonas sp.]
MPDEIDRAQAINERLQSDALAAHFRRHPRPDPGAFAPTECEDCGEPIGEKRLAAAPGCIRCVDCQTEYEQRLKRG